MHTIIPLHNAGEAAMFAILIFFAGYFFIQHFQMKKSNYRDKNDSLGILKKRLALGEITADEFNEIKKYL